MCVGLRRSDLDWGRWLHADRRTISRSVTALEKGILLLNCWLPLLMRLNLPLFLLRHLLTLLLIVMLNLGARLELILIRRLVLGLILLRALLVVTHILKVLRLGLTVLLLLELCFVWISGTMNYLCLTWRI